MRDAGEWEKCFQTGAVKAERRAGRLCGRRCFGARGESFSLENLEKEIHKGFNLTFQELQMMSNQTITLQNI